MGPSLAFDQMAAQYDQTRTFHQPSFNAALDHLQGIFPPDRFPLLVEPGIGTGRIAIPLAQRGYKVAGIDLSQKMLAGLTTRVRSLELPPCVWTGLADATRLPFADGCFDLGIAVHLFYFIPAWKQAADELLRVVRPGGAIILMHTGTGTEVPELNERYKAICSQLGFQHRPIGVNSTRQVVDHYVAEGCRISRLFHRWRWVNVISIGDALRHLEARAYSFASVVPADIHREVMTRLVAESLDAHGGPDAVVRIPNELYLVIVERPRA